MTVRCPQCLTDYLLPESLLGPRGARVRCPSCRHSFVVPPDPGDVAGGEDTGRGPAAEADTPAPQTTPARPQDVAAGILEALVARLGPALEEACRNRRPFAQFGPELLGAFDEYQAAVGPGAPPAAFHAALRARLGIDLPVSGGD